MCITAIQTSPGCHCHIIRHFVCIKHIDHTRKQLDTNPCPELEIRNIETDQSDCHRDPMIDCKRETCYTFEGHPRQLSKTYNIKFCEPYADDFAECFDGKMRYGFQHDCGIGLSLHRQKKWRHIVDQENEDLKKVEAKKEVYIKKDNPADDDVFGPPAADTEMADLEVDVKKMIIKDENMEG